MEIYGREKKTIQEQIFITTCITKTLKKVKTMNSRQVNKKKTSKNNIE